MMIPDFMPVLSRGSHDDPAKGACFMEYVSLLAGEPFSDLPNCVDADLGKVMQAFNDSFRDADRPRLVPFLDRAIGLVTPGLPLASQYLYNDLRGKLQWEKFQNLPQEERNRRHQALSTAHDAWNVKRVALHGRVAARVAKRLRLNGTPKRSYLTEEDALRDWFINKYEQRHGDMGTTLAESNPSHRRRALAVAAGMRWIEALHEAFEFCLAEDGHTPVREIACPLPEVVAKVNQTVDA